jgi:broad specificity phosphatase PhoE
METARIISEEAGILTPAIVDRDLREIGMGSAEGLTESEMASVWPERQRTMRGERMSLEVPDGETLIELGKRLSYALSRIITTPVDAKVIVSHGVASRVLQALYLGKSPQDAANFNAPHDAIFQLHASGVLMLKC